MSAPIIDTLKALDVAHKLYAKSLELEKTDPDKTRELDRAADSGLSAVIPYLKNRQAPVQQRHADAIQKMLDYAEKEL